MEKKTNIYAITLMCEAIRIMAMNAWDSMMEAGKDTLRGICKHPVVALLVISAMIYCFVKMAEARAERDHSAQVQLQLQTRIEQLSL